MSKYIIDIPNVIEWGVVTCRTEDEFYTRDFDSLEELNSDYINEHFGDLQDTAYDKGYAQCQDDYGDALKHAKDTAYQKGLAEGREQMPCDTCAYRHNNLLCTDCKWNYGSRYKVDSIGVGDVVEAKSGTIFVVTKITADGFAVGFTGDGNTCCFDITKLTKTGEHYNINEILGGLSDD